MWAEGGESWARHFISSVGVLTTQVANPPIAPARKVVQRLGGVLMGVRRAEVRLYVMKRMEFRAP